MISAITNSPDFGPDPGISQTTPVEPATNAFTEILDQLSNNISVSKEEGSKMVEDLIAYMLNPPPTPQCHRSRPHRGCLDLMRSMKRGLVPRRNRCGKGCWAKGSVRNSLTIFASSLQNIFGNWPKITVGMLFAQRERGQGGRKLRFHFPRNKTRGSAKMPQPLYFIWCLGRESNSYGDKLRGILSPLRLPIPPPRRGRECTQEPISKRPLLRDLCVMLKFQSSKYEIYSCG